MRRQPLQALTIWQPWAWAIFHPTLKKDIENREWPTDYRGLLAVHAGSSTLKGEFESAIYFMRSLGARDEALALREYPSFASPEMVRGAIIGLVTVVDCVSGHDSPWFMGRYGFVLKDPLLFERPIRCPGARKLWTVPEEYLAEMRIEYRRAIQAAA